MHMTTTRRLLLLAGCTLVAWHTTASAQTFYKWTDDGGVVHLSDAPPVNVKGVEERNLRAEPAVKSSGIEPAEGSADAAPKEGDAKDAEGPARVILTSHQTPRTGPSAMHIIGVVKNVGGAEARRVSITISAVDSTQGTPCLNEEAAVTPSTLRPGQTGNFDVDVDSPCLAGDTNVDLAPVWD
jgi:uncharacterized protein DUF4124